MSSLFTEYDLYLFREGNFFESFQKLGAHPRKVGRKRGVNFAVWAPNARAVSVIGDFNKWEKGVSELKPLEDSGIWEGFIPEASVGSCYKFYVESMYNGFSIDKSDPYAFFHEIRPSNASVVAELDGYSWSDRDWMVRREKPFEDAMSIYEVHLGSWRRKLEEGDRFLTYQELAKELPDYVARMGFTHVELLPVTEHPFDGSWGYQTTGYFAPTSRFGSPQDFMSLVDALHQAGIGVILDWVPAHFPSDGHGLGYFDGTHLYEHADDRQGFHPDWRTLIFNFGRTEVQNFLISSALFWLEKYHIDGLRVDAVASMLYLDYSREDGAWVPNKYGGRENLEAIAFLKRFNEVVHEKHPTIFTAAEESTAWPMVSRPTYDGGLGFDYKWNMGWMNDSLRYMEYEPVYRSYHHGELTFSMIYAFDENFILPLSHDEVVHGKRSIVEKMPGDDWQKFANVRLLYGYMYTHPGKKLLFMGDEFAQRSEWSHDRSLDWHLLEYGSHQGVQRWVSDLNGVLKEYPALHVRDFTHEGFRWVVGDDHSQSTIAFTRSDKEGKEVLVVANFTPIVREAYRVGVSSPGEWKEILNSDAEAYGGSGVGNSGGRVSDSIESHGLPHSLCLTIPPLGVLLLSQ